MTSKNYEIHVYLKDNAPLEFIKTVLFKKIPGPFEIIIPKNKSRKRIDKLFNPQLIISIPSSQKEHRTYLLAAELLTLQYGRTLKIGKQEFPFYRDTEGQYNVLNNHNGELPHGSNVLVFSRGGQKLLTQTESDYYFHLEHEERVDNELNHKYLRWDTITTRHFFESFLAEAFDKGRTQMNFEQYIAPLIPVFEKYDLDNNLNLILPVNHNKLKRI